jgi:hypothetical protein
VKDKAEAAACSIVDTQLSCDGKIIGVNRHKEAMLKNFGLAAVDMVAIEVAEPWDTSKPENFRPITKGFSLDAENVLHLRNADEFKRLLGNKGIIDNQNGEAKFGKYQGLLYYQLGCPGGNHKIGNAKPGHEMLYTGTAVAVPL